jgi:tetratricopeptide (TPR) repeat protein
VPHENNTEAYAAVAWILSRAKRGFFIAVASAKMQRKVAGLYATPGCALIDYAREDAPFDYAQLEQWSEEHSSSRAYFLLSFQNSLRDDESFLRLNLSRDLLTKKHKLWLFFLTPDADDLLAKKAPDFYSYIQMRAVFDSDAELPDEIPEPERMESGDQGNRDARVMERARKEALRYEKLDHQLLALAPEEGTGIQQLAAAITLSTSAAIHRDAGEYVKALPLLEKALGIRERVLGEEHPDTATSYNNLAHLYQSMGDYAKALPLYEKALAICERVLGEEHPSTATSYNNLACLYESMGDSAKALPLREKARDIRKRVSNREHPNT